ncbi:unnamed protein product [Rotaria magnacalcarata]|uniref:Uncharacterized protein n=1 Tax=Rotaria magnacalcarata TaxID=392030 RepID=A0A816RUQ3_9BILA|nr:unnamed protein product [Rotaria magnacalcarata]CAF1585314.1 unnamed protein product [Rotaria magnacalcarata]CAF2046034.1 unnamed protein product [Rotaria magnacalcarata]CAF2076021.1 unnamed protein product [Rotaria magnacalcarata]CAF2159251.1 unnamed protein product [Rotaria magnacalcarata]
MLRIKIDGDQEQGSVFIDTLKLSEQKSGTKILTKNDVTSLYLNNRSIRSIPSLSIFPHLNCLSIDGNHLQDLEFIKTNFSLGELYAGNNHISNIKGSLSHLKNLRVVHLQNNQISNLNRLAYELRHLSALEDLNLFDNPVTFVYGYKSTMIDLLPKLRVLDRKTVSNNERTQAFNDRHPDRQKVLNRIGFAYHLEPKQEENSFEKTKSYSSPLSIRKSTVQIRENNPNDQSHEQMLNEALRIRALRRSITEYSQFDWNKIPIGAEKRLMEAENAVTQPDVISIFFQ